jgi:hypothetical protein
MTALVVTWPDRNGGQIKALFRFVFPCRTARTGILKRVSLFYWVAIRRHRGANCPWDLNLSRKDPWRPQPVQVGTLARGDDRQIHLQMRVLACTIIFSRRGKPREGSELALAIIGNRLALNPSWHCMTTGKTAPTDENRQRHEDRNQVVRFTIWTISPILGGSRPVRCYLRCYLLAFSGAFRSCFVRLKPLFLFGAGWGIRTSDHLITNQVLYQLS